MDIRNIAIISHVDHGKTTLTDALMAQTDMLKEGESMDSDTLEQERGITIYSKNTSIYYQGGKINIVDTPGHADFGSEVERVLRSIDSVLLIVDAQEGPMPQTKFVLKKALELGLKPMVVINKIDKPGANIEEVEEMVYELFLDLGADDDQLNFETIYAISKDGTAKKNMNEEAKDLTPLLETIVQQVQPTSSEELNEKELLVQPFNLGYDSFLGRLAIGRIYQGTIKNNQKVVIKKDDDQEGNYRIGNVTKLFTFEGLGRKSVDQAEAGDIIMVAGLNDVCIGETICKNKEQTALPSIKVDQPTVSLNILLNNSPFAGQEGKYVTNRQLKERLEKELEVNVGLQVDFSSNEYYKVYGRGEMHLAILIENMRREGYEMQISQPNVIIKEEEGQKYEPFEEVTINVPESVSGTVIEKLNKRRGDMTKMSPEHGHVKLVFEIPTRGLLGYRNEFVVDTKGEGIIYTRVIGFKPYAGDIAKNELGSMISMATGKALAFSLYNLQDRGTLYIKPTTEVYEGMVVGNSSKGDDMTVNPTKGKQLTNVRAAGSDEAIDLVPPVELDLERGMGVMSDDEYLEITPKNIRLRKKILKESDRKRQ